MNTVCLVGRLTRDPEVHYTNENLAICNFTVAINRAKDGADFPSVVVFGKTAENCGKYLKKGDRVGVEGRIQTGSYERPTGEKVYTTKVSAHRVEFLESKSTEYKGKNSDEGYSSFKEADDEFLDIPF